VHVAFFVHCPVLCIVYPWLVLRHFLAPADQRFIFSFNLRRSGANSLQTANGPTNTQSDVMLNSEPVFPRSQAVSCTHHLPLYGGVLHLNSATPCYGYWRAVYFDLTTRPECNELYQESRLIGILSMLDYFPIVW
jgi:hypothetical protein